MNYRLLALDLDGTLVDSSLKIHDAVRSAITTAQARGVHITLATGRPFGATLPFAEQLLLDDPVICFQGALIRHPRTGEVYQHITMPVALAAEGVNLLLEAGIFVVACIDQQSYVAERRPELDLYVRYHPEGVELVVEPDLPGVVAALPPTKLLFVADPPVVGSMVARLADHFGDRLGVVRSHAYFGELTAPGISKGAALACLAARLGIPQEQVIAIGDQENDLSMINWAGLGLAMGNAVPAVRAAADAVIPPVQEAGVAWAIEQYIVSGDKRMAHEGAER